MKRIECAIVQSSLKSLKVFDPDTVRLPALPPRANQKLLYVNHHHKKLTEAIVIFIVDVPALNVSPDATKFHQQSIKLDHNVTPRVSEPVD